MKLEDALKTTKFKDAKHKATLNILYTSYWLKSSISTVMKDNSITMEQYNVLRILKGKHPERMCVKDIGSRMIERSSNVPRIIDRLVVKKLVDRTISKEDKRETLIMITAKGIDLLEKTTKQVDEHEKRLSAFTEEDAQMLNDLLEKLRQIAE
ncbi:MAG: MarR family transcriptional regulator [Bacteroidota bacterium]